jgi:hypothetical protein
MRSLRRLFLFMPSQEGPVFFPSQCVPITFPKFPEGSQNVPNSITFYPILPKVELSYNLHRVSQGPKWKHFYNFILEIAN